MDDKKMKAILADLLKNMKLEDVIRILRELYPAYYIVCAPKE